MHDARARCRSGGDSQHHSGGQAIHKLRGEREEDEEKFKWEDPNLCHLQRGEGRTYIKLLCRGLEKKDVFIHGF